MGQEYVWGSIGGRRLRAAVAIVVISAGWIGPRTASAYSVQSHEQLIDLVWKPAIVPLLEQRFPGITPAQLTEAHAYAYGGCAIQDLGYYPLGKELFSDLTHYVRSGDFIRSLLRNARTPDELAFAVGALSHYVGDVNGHAFATNPSVGREFPGLEKKFGPVVTYEENPHAHVRTEFAFDINEISKHRFAPSAYLKHVGLKVAGDLLHRAFFETYGLRVEDILGGSRSRPALTGYRFAVRSFLPRIAYAETVLHRHRMPPDLPGDEFVALRDALAQSEFENGWDQYRKKPGIGTYTLAGLIFIAPKIGPLAMLGIRGPDSTAEQAYVSSVNRTFKALLHTVNNVQQGDRSQVIADTPNRDLDTGAVVRPGAYRLTDATYAKLLDVVTRRGLKVPTGLVSDIDAYYSDPAAPISTRKNPERWAKVQAELAKLNTMPTVPEP